MAITYEKVRSYRINKSSFFTKFPLVVYLVIVLEIPLYVQKLLRQRIWKLFWQLLLKFLQQFIRVFLWNISGRFLKNAFDICFKNFFRQLLLQFSENFFKVSLSNLPDNFFKSFSGYLFFFSSENFSGIFLTKSLAYFFGIKNLTIPLEILL